MIRLVLIGVLLLLWAVPVQAAEVLQVRSSSLLQVGDHNRTYTVALACSAVDASQEAEATAWLRQGTAAPSQGSICGRSAPARGS